MTCKKPRRSERLTKSVPILLIGSDTEGRVFTERTHTVVLSLHGAGIVSTHKLLAEQEMVLRLLLNNREAEIRVVGEIASTGKRYCGTCGFATVWKRPEPGTEPRVAAKKLAPKPPVKVETGEVASAYGVEQVDFAHDWGVQLPVETAVESPPPSVEASLPVQVRSDSVTVRSPETRTTAAAVEERRNRVRAKVNYFACVRSERFGDDVVSCIDMSRGGLGFRTKNAYLISTEVRIAVPFSPESPNAPMIFVPARVVNVMELPGRQMFRCGEMFLPER